MSTYAIRGGEERARRLDLLPSPFLRSFAAD
jgi:hypothetical protein